MLNLNSLMLGTSQIDKMASFYEAVFEKKADMVDNNWHGWQVGSCFIGIGEHSEVEGKAKEPQRLLFNLETKDVQGEFERIKAIAGVTVVKEPYEMGPGLIATLADPDGNYFQLMSPWESDKN